MNILLINHYAGSPEMGMEFRPYYLASEWSREGHSVTIIAGSYSHLRSRNPTCIDILQMFRKLIRKCNAGSVEYLWLWTNKYKGNGIMRFCSMLIFVLQLLVLSPWLSIKKRPDVVIASSTYPLDIFPAWIIARLSKSRLIFEIHDLWPLSPMQIGKMSKYHPFILSMRLGEWFAYKFSDKIISILPATYRHVEKDGVPKERWAHVPNGVLLKQQKEPIPANLRVVISGKKSEGYFVVGYAGSIGAANALDALIDAANRLKHAKIFFVIVGDGPEKARLVKLAKSKNILFYDKIPKAAIPDLLAQMDLLCITWHDNPIYEYGISPNKLFDYMLAKKPILQAINTKHDPVIEAGCGMAVMPENPAALADAILEFSQMSKSKLDKMGESGYNYVVSKHNYAKLAQDFLRYCCE